MLHPVAGAFEAHDFRRVEMLQAAVLLRVGGPALGAVDQQRRTGDARPEFLDRPARHVVGRPGADVVVELPAVGAVLVLDHALFGQVARLFGREVLVLLLHPPEGVLDGGIAARHAAGELALFGDPVLHAFGEGGLSPLLQDFRRRAQPLDRDQTPDVLRVDAGIAQRDVAAQRVRHHRHRRQLLLMNQLRQVVDIAAHGVVAVGRPLAVAMAAQVRRDDVPVIAEAFGHPVPVPAVIPPPVHQQQRRRVRIAPVDVMQPEALGEIGP